jgi:inositol 2-dehydrogenase
MKSRINIGVVGLGRMGLEYARFFNSRIAGARLVAVSDIRKEIAAAAAAELGGVKAYTEYRELVSDPAVDAVVVMTPTKLHKEVVVTAAAARKAIFCEKPISLGLDDAIAMKAAVETYGAFFQLGFMRRFDPGYAMAKKKIAEGAIGTPCVFKSSSRDKARPSLDYLQPANSGGLFIDMGIHDFDLARWFFGEVKSVYSVGGVLAYPEMRDIGDPDNSLTNMIFSDGRVGMVSLSRNGVFGYSIQTEIVGTEGTLLIGREQETPLLIMTKDTIAHDTVPGFYERFEASYVIQLQDFVDNVTHRRKPAITCDDGIAAQKIALAATRSWKEGSVVAL